MAEPIPHDPLRMTGDKLHMEHEDQDGCAFEFFGLPSMDSTRRAHVIATDWDGDVVQGFLSADALLELREAITATLEHQPARGLFIGDDAEGIPCVWAAGRGNGFPYCLVRRSDLVGSLDYITLENQKIIRDAADALWDALVNAVVVR